MGGALRSLVAKMFASIGSFAVKIFGCGYAALGLNEFFNAMFRMKIFQIVVPVCVAVKTKYGERGRVVIRLGLFLLSEKHFGLIL